MSPPTEPPRAPIAIREAPAAPAGSGDPTRRWALAFPDGATRFPGIARTEGQAVLAALEGVAPADWDRHLVEVTLPVLLSEGAGPHLLDAGGRLTLALGAHPALEGERVAMGEAAPRPAGRARSGGPGRPPPWPPARPQAPGAARGRG